MSYNIKEDNPNWKGGKSEVNGYTHILCENHPKTNYNGYVREHILIAEKTLGKLLPNGAVIHHVNEKKNDNRNSNLVICENNDYHKFIHKRIRVFKACGNVEWVKCRECKQFDNPKNMSIFHRKTNVFIHRECNNKRMNNYYHRKEKDCASST